MCGLAGIIFGKKRRTAKERQHLLDIFTRLLVLSEARGHHATGVAWVKTDGTYDLFKAPMPASEFIHESRYADIIAGVDNKTTILMGHTRWRTQGSEFNNDNNHPLIVGDPSPVLVAHNGHITNSDALFRRFRFSRRAQVDSEILAHFAARASKQGTWDLNRLQRDLALCRGTLAVVLASAAIPDEVLIVRGNKPLYALYNSCHRALLYASDTALLDLATQNTGGWRNFPIPAMKIMAFHHEKPMKEAIIS